MYIYISYALTTESPTIFQHVSISKSQKSTRINSSFSQDHDLLATWIVWANATKLEAIATRLEAIDIRFLLRRAVRVVTKRLRSHSRTERMRKVGRDVSTVGSGLQHKSCIKPRACPFAWLQNFTFDIDLQSAGTQACCRPRAAASIPLHQTPGSRGPGRRTFA